MAQKLSLSDFSFMPSGRGCYLVTYKSPTGRIVRKDRVCDMQLIDLTKNSKAPSQRNLRQLRSALRV